MFKNSIKLMTMILLAGLVMFTSCKKDDDTPTTPVIVLDGYYVVGAGTSFTTYDAKAMMTQTPNEVGQVERASLLELFITVNAGAEGFNIVQVAGSVVTTWGPADNFAVVDPGTTDEPKVPFQRGGLSETANVFTVPTDGLYHVIIDTELGRVAVVPVQYWGMIGAATPGGWSNDTKLEPEAYDMSTMTFKITDLKLTKGDFKYRYSGGWKVEIDTTAINPDEWVKVNTNFGSAVDALVPGGANIVNDVPGLYTATMTWTVGEGFTANLEKTGDLDIKDYTDVNLGLVGDGLIIGGVQMDWTLTHMLQVPVVEDVTNYTWTYAGVEVTTLGSFKIRQGQTWDSISIGYSDVTMAGLSADKFETNGDGNFVPLEDGIFDMVLFIDAVTEEYTFTINPAGVSTEMYMLGDATSAGYNADDPIPMDGTGGIYTITADLLGGGGIKFITTIGAWQPQYGTDATGTSAAGPLFVNDGTGTDPDPIPGPVAGTYLITMNTNDMTYTIVAAK